VQKVVVRSYAAVHLPALLEVGQERHTRPSPEEAVRRTTVPTALLLAACAAGEPAEDGAGQIDLPVVTAVEAFRPARSS
jgi:hypothetical protein